MLAQLPRALVGSPHPWRDLKLCGCGTWGHEQGGLDSTGGSLGSMSQRLFPTWSNSLVIFAEVTIPCLPCISSPRSSSGLTSVPQSLISGKIRIDGNGGDGDGNVTEVTGQNWSGNAGLGLRGLMSIM